MVLAGLSMDEMLVEIGLGIQDETLLPELQLMENEHQNDADEERYECGVEGHTQALSHTGDVSFHGLMCLPKGLTNTPYRTYEPNRGDRPSDVAHHRELRVQAL